MNSFNCNSPDIQDRLIAENALAFAFLTKMPIVPGHALLCPKRAIPFSHDLHANEWEALLSLKTDVCNCLKKALHAEGFNFAWNEGLNAGQSVPHFHLHVVPRKAGDAGITLYEPRVFLYRPGSRAVTPHEELVLFAKSLKKLIAN